MSNSKGFCIYLRKSRNDIEAEARGEGETLARHEKILLDLAHKQKLSITEIYKEVVSGETISARPVMQHLLNEVEQGLWLGVLVVEVERLARGDTVDQGIVAQSFKYSNTKIITPMKIYNPGNEFDEEYFEFGLFMSRREYKTINRRLQRGRLESVKEGKYLGNIPPYGYKRKKLEHEKGYTLEIIPSQAKVINLIYNLYCNGEILRDEKPKQIGVSLIAAKLNELGIKPVKGDIWTPSTLRGILSNPVYIGKIRWNSRKQVKSMVNGKMTISRPRAKQEDWILIEGLHEAIIDETLFKQAQAIRKNRVSIPMPNKSSIKNPLAGLVVCGVCGRKMVRRPYNNGYPDGLICTIPSCRNVSSKLSIVEEKIIEALGQCLADYQFNIDINNQKDIDLEYEINKDTISSYSKEISTLEKQLDSLHNLLEQGVYSTETFIERSKKITTRINSLKAETEKLNLEITKNNSTEKIQSDLVPKIEKLLDIYFTLDSASERNSLLKSIINHVTYTKSVGGRWHAQPDDFELTLFPKI